MASVDPARLSVSERDGTALKAAVLELKREVPSDADLEALRGEILQRLGFEHSDSGVRLLPEALRTRTFDLAVAPCCGDERRAPIAASNEGQRARAKGRRRHAHQCTVLVGALLAAAAVALLVMTRNGGLPETPPTGRHSDGGEPQTGVHGAAPSPQNSASPVVAPGSASARSEGALDKKHANGVRGDRGSIRSRGRVASSSGERSASTPMSGVEASGASGVININSIPFTRVVLDGRVLGGTPLVGVTVSPGEHTVLFVDYDGERRLKKVNVDPGRTVLAAVRFD